MSASAGAVVVAVGAAGATALDVAAKAAALIFELASFSLGGHARTATARMPADSNTFVFIFPSGRFLCPIHHIGLDQELARDFDYCD
jgi:hypothetical protein